MKYKKFLEQLSSKYNNYGTDAIHPKNEVFESILQKVKGMTTSNILQLVNWAVECMEENEYYCEIGTYQGSTLIGALINQNNKLAYAVDNFSEFDADGSNFKKLQENLSFFQLKDQVNFYSQNFEEFFLNLNENSSNKQKIGVYFYDGAHDYRSQLIGLLMAVPFLASKALIIVDDTNLAHAQQANFDFLALQPHAKLELNFLTPRNAHNTFWNGISVFSWDSSKIQNPTWLELNSNFRNHEVIESLYTDFQNFQSLASKTKVSSFAELPAYYKHLRSEIFNSVPANALNILDIGCGAGVLGKALKTNNNKRYVVGIELNKDAVYFAKQNLDQVYEVDVEKVNLPFKSGFFDCIIFADILEHLVDPWQTLRNYLNLLKYEGTIIISIPNIRNLKIIHQLIDLKSWKYEDEGILDRTHLRFFTKNDFLRVLEEFNIEVKSVVYLRENRFNQFYNDHNQTLTLGNISLNNISQEDFEEITANQIVFQGIYQEKITDINNYNQFNLDKISLANISSQNYSLSIIVPWWDHTEFLELWENNLNYLPNCEIVFIDNGSQEEGKKALASFCEQHQIKLIRNEKNRGFAAANNQGLAASTGDYILHLNNDLSIQELDIQYLCRLAGEGIAGPGYARNELNIPYVEGWGLCAKKSVLENLGGWNEDYGPGYWDDVDLCYRAKLAGYPVTAIPQMSQWIKHITNATGRDGRVDQIALHLTNRKKFIDKYFNISPKIVIDAVFFQLYKTGIARVWRSLLQQWANTEFANHILVLDRNNTTPKINGIRYRTIAGYDYNNTESDRQMLQQICDEEGAELFISTYYTTPINTPSVFMAYDMIPEIVGGDLNQPMWREKHKGINHASAFIAISENTAKDINKFFPDIPLESITVAHCGVDTVFRPASETEINNFKYKYGINKPYFLVGGLRGYKNSILFFQAFAQLTNKESFDIVATGAGSQLLSEWRQYTLGSTFHGLQLSDEELRLAYAGAVALVYPSKYEGFGMPVVEAMACGCPVITTPNASLPEAGGEAVIYVKDDNIQAMANALCEVQKPSLRHHLIQAGLQQAKKFSWVTMAEKVRQALINVILPPLKLSETNYIIFPDWYFDEESLTMELMKVIKQLATQAENQGITLLIDITDKNSEEVELILSGITMNLIMEQDLEIPENLEISLIDNLTENQYQWLFPQITARIQLENENQEAIIKFQADELICLNFNGGNYIIFPDWQIEEETLALELKNVIQKLVIEKQNISPSLLIDTTGINTEEANMVLSSVAINLMLEENIDISESLQISLLGELSEIQWQCLLPQITARIQLENENQAGLNKVSDTNLPLVELNN